MWRRISRAGASAWMSLGFLPGWFCERAVSLIYQIIRPAKGRRFQVSDRLWRSSCLPADAKLCLNESAVNNHGSADCRTSGRKRRFVGKMKKSGLGDRTAGGDGEARGGRKRATLSDVARRARVSAVTVSRALRRPEMVSAELRQRVEAAVRRARLYPQPRWRARLPRRAPAPSAPSSHRLTNGVFADYLRALHDAFLPRGFQVLVLNSPLFGRARRSARSPRCSASIRRR